MESRCVPSARIVSVCALVAVLTVAVLGCSQPPAPAPAAAVPTQPPKAAPAPSATTAPPQVVTPAPAKEAKPQAKDAKPEKVAKAEEKKPTKLKAIYSALSGMQSPPWIAKEAGLFEKYGLDVDLAFISTSTTIVPAMLSGEVVLATMGTAPVIAANLSGADLVMVAATTNTVIFYLFGQPSILRVEDLKGKAVGVGRRGASSDFAARYVLPKHGLEPDKDVALVQTGGATETLAALQAGGIQGGVFSIPHTLTAKKQGMRELVDITSLGIPYTQTSVVTRKDYLSKNRETIMSFLMATIEAIAVAKRDKEFTVKVIGKYSNIQDREVLEETYDVIVTKVLPKVPYVTAEGVQTVLNEAAQEDPKAKSAKAEEFFDNRLVKELDDSGFIKKLYGE
ncbi:MAG: ABC transporter substrate-binding protein [Chloroflexi bacterium]|nr:ABC transporter substrate-binding protein [Chloroflexota bacterium]